MGLKSAFCFAMNKWSSARAPAALIDFQANYQLPPRQLPDFE